MTSEERKEGRYRRRKAKRERKRLAYAERHKDPLETFGTPALIRSGRKCRKGVGWKTAVQAYMANLCLNSRKSSREIMDGTWRSKGFREFDIIERGKPRHIKSVDFEERCIQRSLCDNFITPILSRYLIYDNGATLPGKGTDFALARLTKHLRDFYRRHGREGYIWVFDFSKYFSNINIETLKEKAGRYLPAGLQRDMYHRFIDVFRDEGLGLGSQVSQISAVFYGNGLDHLVKDRLGVREYARYNDDGYIICHSLERLKTITGAFRDKCRELGIILNRKKCQTIPLRKPFRFLKTRFLLTGTGKVVKRINQQAVTKERRKLRSFKKFADAGRMSFARIRDLFHTWLYSQNRGRNYHIMANMVTYYNRLFPQPYQPTKPKKKRSRKTYHSLQYIARQEGCL